MKQSAKFSRFSPKSGFTLVELMLVLVILGILAGLVLPKFTGRTEQARVTAAVTQIATFNTALAAYEVDTGSYPREQDGLRALVIQPSDVAEAVFGALALPPRTTLEEILLMPSQGSVGE